MKRHLYLLAIPVMLALAGCQPGTAEYTESEAPKLLRVDSAATRIELAFVAGSYRLRPGEGRRLQGLALSGKISPEDRVTISASGDPLLRKQRTETISSELLRFGILAAASPLAGVPRDHAIIAVGRYLVTLPACPNWSRQQTSDFTNAKASDFGCATASNLGLMVASPADLVGGREVAQADGTPAVSAVSRYLNDKVKLPETTSGAAALAAPSGAAGAPAGGAGAPTGTP